MSFLQRFFKVIAKFFLIGIFGIILIILIGLIHDSYLRSKNDLCDGDKDCKWNEQCETLFAPEVKGWMCMHTDCVDKTECRELPTPKVIHYWQGNYKRWGHIKYDDSQFKYLCLDQHKLSKSDPYDAIGKCKLFENGKVIQETTPHNIYIDL